jgi:carboxyl-terminal processing protease
MLRLIALVLLLSVASSHVIAQDVCIRARTLYDKIAALHVQPRTLDDSYSKDLFKQFFTSLDPESRFLIAQDTAALASYKTLLDDRNEVVCVFVDKAKAMYKARANEYLRFVDSLLSKPLDLKKKEQVPNVFLRNPRIAATRRELRERLVYDLKFDVLASMYRQASADTNNLRDLAAFMKFEPAARLRIKKNALAEVNAMIGNDESLRNLVDESYLRAIPKVFDPHSEYFSPDEAKAFSEMLNPDALSFGIKLEQSTLGDVTVARLVPGGPAWNSNQVNKGDVLVGLQWSKSGEYVDLIDLDAQYVEELLQKPEESAANITIRKPTGETRDVKLVKQKLENEDNIVTGYVLKSKTSNASFGYISLPGFFTDDNSETRGCAVAVTKELMKLKSESIKGLILDLRFNGGGSLYEAIELIGIFIDNGPVGIVETKGKQPTTMKDMNRGLVYDGPLVIMVNGASASASEIVAGTLQDYRRAIIAGSRTYGKATGQMILPLDENDINRGFIKVTDMRLFRVTGQTHQLKGITPDFPIDDIYSILIPREESDKTALDARTVDKKTYFNQWPGYSTSAIQKSIENNTNSEKFRRIPELQRLFASDMPLEAGAFIASMRALENSYKEFIAAPGTGNTVYDVSSSIYDASMLKADPYRSEMSKAVMDQIRNSIYIQETFQLLDNLITVKP